jgi:BMFP domain-containing protein YqiC
VTIEDDEISHVSRNLLEGDATIVRSFRRPVETRIRDTSRALAASLSLIDKAVIEAREMRP